MKMTQIILVFFLLTNHKVNAAYSEHQTRYISGYDFQFKVYQLFSENLALLDEKQINSINFVCSSSNKDWGFISTINGQAFKTEPTLNTANIIQNCFNYFFYQIHEQIMSEFKKTDVFINTFINGIDSNANSQIIQNEKQKLSNHLVTILNPLFSNEMILSFNKNLNPNQPNEYLIFKSISEFNEEQKMELINYLVLQFLGDDQNIMSFQIIKDPLAFKKYLVSLLKSNLSIFENVRQIVKILILRDEFLKY